MTTDAELNSEKSSASAETTGQVQVHQESGASPPATVAATPASEAKAPDGLPVSSAATDGPQAKADESPAAPSVQAEQAPFAQSAAPVPSTSPEAAANPLGEALAALDRRDYATAKRLFEALDRKDAAEAIQNALSALDRKDYATAQGLFEALAPSKTAAAPRPPEEPTGKTQGKPIVALPDVVPPIEAEPRKPEPRVEKASRRRLAPVLLAIAAVLFAFFGVKAVYGSRLSSAFGAARSEALAGLASAVHLVKTPLLAMTGSSPRHDGKKQEQGALKVAQAAPQNAPAARAESASAPRPDAPIEQKDGQTAQKDGSSGGSGARSAGQDAPAAKPDEHPAARDTGAAPAQAMNRVEENSSSKTDQTSPSPAPGTAASANGAPATTAFQLADVVARLETLEKRMADSAPAPQLADLSARLDKLEKAVAEGAAPSSSTGSELKVRLDRLEKKVADATGSGKVSPTAPSKQSALADRADPSVPNNPKPDSQQRRLLRDYNIEGIGDGFAVVQSRYGPQQVGPGDFIPGAGRVLRFERHGGGWYIVTSGGVIAEGPPRY
jgi:hypothetical protein